MLKEHYDYMRHIVTDALAMGAQLRRADELNYLIYLLDRGCLPLNEADIVCKLFLFFRSCCCLLDHPCDIFVSL